MFNYKLYIITTDVITVFRMDAQMLCVLAQHVSRLMLGFAASAPRQRLDGDARLAMTPRTLETELYPQPLPPETTPPRRVGAFLVYQGGRGASSSGADGAPGRPVAAIERRADPPPIRRES